VTRVQIADYLGIPNKDIDFSEQGMQSEEYMHFDIEDDTVAQLIGKGAFKLEKTVDEAHELDRADKIVLAKLMKEYEGYKSMVAKAKDADDSKMYQERLRDLVSMIKHVKGEMKYGIDTALEDELSDMYDAVKGVKEDEGSLDQFRNLYRKSIGSDDAAVTLRELINVINDDSLWSDEFPQLKQFVDVSPQSGSKIVSAKKIPGNTVDEKIQSLVKAIDDDNWINATAKHLMRSFTLGEDDMSTGTVPVGKKGKTRRKTGIGDNPYDHNDGEDQTALVNAALWNMKDVYQTLMAGESLLEDDMFAYGDLVQYLEQADMPDHYSKFWDLVVDAINSAGGFKGQGDEIMVDKNIAPTIKTLYQQFKAATANIKGVTEDDVDAVYPGSGDIYGYTWNCKKCGTENEFSMSRKDAQEYIDDWEADNEDLVADGETGEAALTDTLSQGEDSGFHIGDKCVKCGTEVKDYPYNETISDILKLSGLK
jgi:hypothetical protein